MCSKMKQVISFILIVLMLLSALSCSKKGATSSTSDSTQIADRSRIYKRTELPYPEDISFVNDITYSDISGKIYIIGGDTDGSLKSCITDSSFSMYHCSDLGITLLSGQSIVYAAAGEKFYALISSEAQTDEESEYTYTLNIYDSECLKLSTVKLDIADILPDDTLFRTPTSLRCTNDERLIIAFGDTFLLSDEEGKNIELTELENTDPLFTPHNGYTSYYTDISGFYGVTTDNVTEKLIDYASSGLSDIRIISPIAEDEFICCSGNTLYRLSERSEAEIAEIQELSLAVAGVPDFIQIQGKVAEFNAQSNLYRVNIKNYSDGNEFSIDRASSDVHDLEMDIISGDIPDIVWLDTNEINKLAPRGAFADMYTFIDNDPDYPRSAFLQNYLSATETDGHLYSLSPTFMIETIAAKSEHVQEPDWTFADFMDIYSSMPNDMALFESANNCVAVFSFLTNGGANFIDRAAHTCSFDSQGFIDILDFSSQFPRVDEYDWERYSCRRDTALLSTLYIHSFRDFNTQKQCIFGDDITFAGFPSEIGGNGSVMLLNEQFAIMADSPRKDAAWQFVRSFLSDANYMYNADGIPVTECGLSIAMSDALERPYYVDNGQKMYWDEQGADSYSGTSIDITPMTESDRAYYEQFVRGITRAASGIYIDQQVSGIISEETSRFFAGECSSGQCAEMIQSRLSILLSEQN